MPVKKNPPSPIPQAEPPEPALPAAPVPPNYQTASFTPNQMSQGDERTWASLAHLSVLLNLFTGFGGPIAALIIYVVFKDRSRLVAYHALQSMIFQLIWWFGGGVLIGIIWAIVGTLSAILIGLILIPFAIIATIVIGLLPVGALIYGVIGGIQVSQGQDFKYWLVGDWVRGTLTGL